MNRRELLVAARAIWPALGALVAMACLPGVADVSLTAASTPLRTAGPLAAPSPSAQPPRPQGSAAVPATDWTRYVGINEVHGLAVGPDGTLWAAGDRGLAHFDGSVWKSHPSPEPVRALAFAADGSLWLGTNSGVIHFAPAEFSR